MSPPRFYCPQISSSTHSPDARYFLDSAEAKHATSVLRLRVDDTLTLFDGQGRAVLARVIEAKRDTLGVEILKWFEPQVGPLTDLTLAIALPKGDRQKTLVDAATELGVKALIPILCERGVAQPTDNALDRLRRQVIEACKQCGRNRLMEISEPIRLSDLNSIYPCVEMLKLVAHPYDVAGPRQHLQAQLQGARQPSLLAVGPEGGFTDDEVRLLAQAGWNVVDLGPLVLRIEIAAIAAIAQIIGWYQANAVAPAPSKEV